MYFESKEDDFNELNRLIENQNKQNEDGSFSLDSEPTYPGLESFRTPFGNRDPALPPGLFVPTTQGSANIFNGNTTDDEAQEDVFKPFSTFGDFFNIQNTGDLKQTNKERKQEYKQEFSKRTLAKMNLKSNPFVPPNFQREPPVQTPLETPTETPTTNHEETPQESTPVGNEKLELETTPEDKSTNNPVPLVKEYKVLSKKEIERNRQKNALKNQESEVKKPEGIATPKANEVNKNLETKDQPHKEEQKDHEQERNTGRRASFQKKPINNSNEQWVDEHKTSKNNHHKRDSQEMVNQPLVEINQTQPQIQKKKNKNKGQNQNLKPVESVQARKKSPVQEESNAVILSKRNPANDNPFDQGNMFIQLAESSSSVESAPENPIKSEKLTKSKKKPVEEEEEAKTSPKELIQKEEDQGDKTPQGNLTKKQRKKLKKKAEAEEKERQDLETQKEKKESTPPPQKVQTKKEEAKKGMEQEVGKKFEQVVRHETEEDDKRETKTNSTPQQEINSSKEEEVANQDVPTKSKKKKKKKKQKEKKEEETKFAQSDESRENDEYDDVSSQDNSNILSWPEPNLYNTLFQSMITSMLTSRETEK